MAKFTKSAIAAQINKFHKAAAITDSEFSDVVKNLLTYVYDDFADVNKCNDVSSINTFIAGLKPAYKRVALQFFPKFVGWDFDSTEEAFGKKHAKKKNYDTKKAKAKDFYESDSSVWDWFEENGKKAEKKPTDYKKTVGNALKKAFAAKDDEGNALFTMKDLAACLAAEEIPLRELMEKCEAFAAIQELD